ncbi:unnamed protein product [Cuscuta europaea]|uniref:Uncharacterized protein n=1 Tax=Cuscuta europaea TaxID=41803 RepID=A0A9P1EBS5_CUSEU|nr:unnamed protein product [Cuscuta europaea]
MRGRVVHMLLTLNKSFWDTSLHHKNQHLLCYLYNSNQMVSYTHKSTIIMFRCATHKFSSNAFIPNSQKDYIVEETKVKYSCPEDEFHGRLLFLQRIFIPKASPDFIQADQ